MVIDLIIQIQVEDSYEGSEVLSLLSCLENEVAKRGWDIYDTRAEDENGDEVI